MRFGLCLCALITWGQLTAQSNLDYTVGVDKTYDELIQHVARTHQDKSAIAEFFYYWMAENIQYDYSIAEAQLEASGRLKQAEALEVFYSRKAACSGYAILYKLFLNEFEIECELVEGYAKSKEGLMIQDSLEVAHSWNAVLIGEEWSLVDVTWASTSQKDGKTSSYYFQTPAELFVFNHFPLIPYWQLSREPISFAEFRQLPEVNAEYLQLGFARRTPRLFLEDGQYKLVIGKSGRWKPIISRSETGYEYETVEFKRKDRGDYQELIFPADRKEKFILRLDAYKHVDWSEQEIQTQLAYLVVPPFLD